MSPRRRLDKDIVVRTAAEILEEEGSSALTLHRLAGRLGIKPPSLYNHVKGMSDLQRELALLNARNLAEVMEKAAISRSGVSALTAIAQAYRAYIKSAPALYQYTLRASGNLPGNTAALEEIETRAVQVALAVVESFDLHGDDSIHAVRGLRSLIHGFTSIEVAGGFGMPLDCDESFRRLLNIYARGLLDIAAAK